MCTLYNTSYITYFNFFPYTHTVKQTNKFLIFKKIHEVTSAVTLYCNCINVHRIICFLFLSRDLVPTSTHYIINKNVFSIASTNYD